MYYLGIDLGGTHIACGIVNNEGEIISVCETPTKPERPYQEVIADMGKSSLAAIEKAGLTVDDIAAIGVGIPGIADNTTGRVIFCTNLFWHDVPLKDELAKFIDKPLYIENDATVAGFAESVAGVSKGSRSSVFLTLGTGLGGAIIIDGKPWTGAHGVASELGHLTLEVDGIPCTCGKDGCVERYCSATALIRMGRETCIAHPDCALSKAVGGDVKLLNAKLIIDLAKEGDDLALKIFHRYTRYLALTINSIVSFIDPELVVLGGGVSHAGEFLVNAIKEKLPHYLMFKTMPYADVLLAKLGNQAGIIGAAMLGKIVYEEGKFDYAH